jgi:nitric oxide reductase NorE protein
MTPIATAPESAPRLHGDLAIWLLIGAELLTFGILFVSFAVARWREPAVFAAGQATLTLRSGAVNTLLLLGGSAAVVQAVHSLRQARPAASRRALLVALGCALAFLGLKGHELAGKLGAGVDLDSSTFWMFYLLLTGFHFLHVAVAAIVLALLWWLLRRAPAQRLHALETGGIFWHMVDLLWIVLFPLVYVLR